MDIKNNFFSITFITEIIIIIKYKVMITRIYNAYKHGNKYIYICLKKVKFKIELRSLRQIT